MKATLLACSLLLAPCFSQTVSLSTLKPSPYATNIILDLPEEFEDWVAFYGVVANEGDVSENIRSGIVIVPASRFPSMAILYARFRSNATSSDRQWMNGFLLMDAANPNLKTGTNLKAGRLYFLDTASEKPEAAGRIETLRKEDRIEKISSFLREKKKRGQ